MITDHFHGFLKYADHLLREELPWPAIQNATTEDGALHIHVEWDLPNNNQHLRACWVGDPQQRRGRFTQWQVLYEDGGSQRIATVSQKAALSTIRRMTDTS